MRRPPQSQEAEKGLLSSILQMPDKLLDEFGDKLPPAHFFGGGHAAIYSALQRMHDLQKPIDLLTITEFLREDGKLEYVGGAGYLAELLNFVPTAANAEYYRDIVQRKFLRRVIIETATDLVRQSYDEQSGDEQDLLDHAQAQLTHLTLAATKGEVLQHIGPGVVQVMNDIEKIFKMRGRNQGATLGLDTGFNDLNRMTGGIQNQQLVVIGARPSQGKTAIAVNMAATMAVKNKVPVAIFSLEMSYPQLVRRLVGCVGSLSLQRFRDGFVAHKDTYDDWKAETTKTLQPLHDASIWIDDSGDLSIAMLKARARLAKQRFGVKAIFVDYLQLMRSDSKRAQDSRWQEITEISRTLKAIAKELNLPVIACAQLNRESEGREFGRPKMSDMREGGSIEQDADMLLLLWRPVLQLQNYGERDKLAKKLKLVWQNDQPLYTTKKKTELTTDELAERDRQLREYAVLVLAKQRDGPVNDIRLRFVSDIIKFQNVTEKAWSNRAEERQQIEEEV